jgi:hypothetical protein
MDKASESLFRSTLHDMANILAGIRGIVDLSDPDQPLPRRDRERLEAAFEEGNSILRRCRHLAMDTLPTAALEPGAEWRDRLLEEIAPLATLFRRECQLDLEAAPQWDQWPGPRMRALAHAITRQVLPYAKDGPMAIVCVATAEAWRIRWSPVQQLPDQLVQAPGHPPLDTCGQWAAAIAADLGATLTVCDGALEARVPR